MSMRRPVDDWGQLRIAQALDSLEDAITLLEWRYAYEAEPSITRLQQIRDELRTALLFAAGSEMPLH